MPRSRGSELPQRQSQRTPLHLKMAACSEANALHGSPAAADRSSSKPLDEQRRPHRGPLPQIKKRSGTKVADLETKLSRAQEELKKLKDQLASAEASKLEAERALDKAKEQIPSPPPANSQENAIDEEEATSGPSPAAIGKEEAKKDEIFLEKEEKKETEANGGAREEKKEAEESTGQEKTQESGELVELQAHLLEKEKEIEFLFEGNAIFKRKAREEAEKLAATARSKEDELNAKLSSMKEELHGKRTKAEQLDQQLKAAQGEKAALEAELKRLKVQATQWQKAAEAAAAVLTGGGEEGELGSGPRVVERCVSMDKRLLGGGGGHVGWRLTAEDMEEDGVTGRRKSTAGIRRLGDLWKMKKATTSKKDLYLS